eukprot:Gb_25601 [translate_table: standard]
MENEFRTPAGKKLLPMEQSGCGGDFSCGQTPQKTPTVDMMKAQPILMENNIDQQNNVKEIRRGSPPEIQVPLHKLFGFPGRYMSPTDSIISPVSESLLARHKKMLLPPTLVFSPLPKSSLSPLHSTRPPLTLPTFDLNPNRIKGGKWPPSMWRRRFSFKTLAKLIRRTLSPAVSGQERVLIFLLSPLRRPFHP